MKVFTVKDVRIRYKHPGTSAKVKGIIFKGFEIDVDGQVDGEAIGGNSKWYFDKFDNYYWSGGVVEQVTPVDVEVRPGATLGWALQAMHIPEIWQHTRGASAKVAVLDTGISIHPDLGPVERSKDFYNQDDRCPDGDGHGTHTSGIIAAKGLERVTGVAPDCRLFFGRINKRSGSLRKERLVAGIEWATQVCQADIINISAGLFDDFDDVRAAVEQVDTGKTVIVAAIGNNGAQTADAGLYPAKYPACISVGAVDSAFSLIPETDRFTHLTVAAPGKDIESTSLNGGYKVRSGTSMAAAFVSGLLALLISYIRENDLDVTLPQLKRILADSASANTVDKYAYKLVDAIRALNALR